MSLALKSCAALGEVNHVAIARRTPLEKVLYNLRNSRIITGHFSYGIHKYLPDVPYRYATALRHPVERTMSVHSYVKACAKKRGIHSGIKYFKDNLIEFTRGYWQARNVATRMLSGVHLMDTRELCEADFLRAKDNLERIDFVGITSDLNGLAQKLEPYGVDGVVQTRHVTSANKFTSLDEETFRVLSEINTYDMRLFEVAKGRS